ncbi:MAG: ATP-binding protein [Rickettsiaceae bacterium]|nr:ATP-binding protein [Rickettsiaceae bacterium]
MLREEILALSKTQLEHPIIIDEVHWLIENTQVTFVFCGSSSRRLKQGGSNLLGGRAIRYNFYPLIYPEYQQEFDLLKIFNQGLIPSHFVSKDPRTLLQSYIEDYVTNEIRAEGYVRNITAFSRFLDSTRFSCSEMLNYTNVAWEVGIDAKTIKEYYQILVDTSYTKKISRNIISHTPKFYYFDVGLTTRLSKKSFTELVGADAAKALENYVLMELIAYVGLNDSDYNLFYWRTNTEIEIDFILSNTITKPIPIEVKISKNLHKTELRSIKSFMEELY